MAFSRETRTLYTPCVLLKPHRLSFRMPHNWGIERSNLLAVSSLEAYDDDSLRIEETPNVTYSKPGTTEFCRCTFLSPCFPCRCLRTRSSGLFFQAIGSDQTTSYSPVTRPCSINDPFLFHCLGCSQGAWATMREYTVEKPSSSIAVGIVWKYQYFCAVLMVLFHLDLSFHIRVA